MTDPERGKSRISGNRVRNIGKGGVGIYIKTDDEVETSENDVSDVRGGGGIVVDRPKRPHEGSLKSYVVQVGAGVSVAAILGAAAWFWS